MKKETFIKALKAIEKQIQLDKEIQEQLLDVGISYLPDNSTLQKALIDIFASEFCGGNEIFFFILDKYRGITTDNKFANEEELYECITESIKTQTASGNSLYVIELSDEELKIVTKKELDEMYSDAIKFDGFFGFSVKGRLV